jgi:hypothetical protein
MTGISRIWRWGFAALFALGLHMAAWATPIDSLHVRADFSANSAKTVWSVPVTRTDGSTAFVLSLEPDIDISHNVTVLELTLRRPDARADDSNLFDPTGTRHGLQSYDFAAADFSRGIGASAFGPNRVVALKSIGVVVEIKVLSAVVTQVSQDNYRMEALDLQIDVMPSKK